MNLNINTQVDMEDLIDLEMVAQTIQDCMEYGETTHPHDSWRLLSMRLHIWHAEEHVKIAHNSLIKDKIRRELQHAMTRLAMAYVLLREGDEV
jgi:hypothetical protein